MLSEASQEVRVGGDARWLGARGGARRGPGGGASSAHTAELTAPLRHRPAGGGGAGEGKGRGRGGPDWGSGSALAGPGAAG